MKNQIKKSTKIHSVFFSKTISGFSKPPLWGGWWGFALIFLFCSTKIIAQESKFVEIKITTSAVCNMCKETIEKALAFEKGVKKSTLDVPSKVVTVVYNPTKTTPEKIRQAISNAGYDADDVKANPKAYKKLDECCKKENATHE